MLISVVIPTFNRAFFLKSAIDSVLEQSYSHFELIVVDDYSTDDTKELVCSYKDERIRYLQNRNVKGAQGARNTGLNEAVGDWIAMLDSDDVWFPHRLEEVVQSLGSASEDVVGVVTAYAIYDFESQRTLKVRIPKKNRYDSYKEIFYMNSLGGFSMFVFKRKTGLDIGGFDERFPALQDMDFYISILKKGAITVVPNKLVLQRISSNDRISTDFSKKLTGAQLLENKYFPLIKDDFRLRCRSKARIILFYRKTYGTMEVYHMFWMIPMLIFDFPSFVTLLKSIIKNQ
ncbi:glycosyltransferase family 2 protein [Algoriphagus sp. NG3]|uniref:glycosyltransferase family 2 protein n=1 Tax=Algoriphagus sp. NG3 TaxID=3097546 RepID=UPI002A81B50B|nr:glycosyltransferase family 2 protein [Algoriphagus sp. NG3]WPR77827.1 glycosyltransferase family 2 protein [Algoriphagus sp. NG3]